MERLALDDWASIATIAGGVAATFSLVGGAFYGLSRVAARPRLTLCLPFPEIADHREAAVVRLTQPPHSVIERSHFIQVRVANRSRLGRGAESVRVLLTRLALPRGERGEMETVWSLPLQTSWTPSERHIEFKAIPAGQEEYADAFHCGERKGMQLRMRDGNYKLEELFLNARRFEMEFRAVASAAKSRPFTISVNWNGEWDNSRYRMFSHLAIEANPRALHKLLRRGLAHTGSKVLRAGGAAIRVVTSFCGRVWRLRKTITLGISKLVLRRKKTRAG